METIKKQVTENPVQIADILNKGNAQKAIKVTLLAAAATAALVNKETLVAVAQSLSIFG